jgi:hypothetical protein
MSYEIFPLAVKSTIDKLAIGLADSESLAYIDIDGVLLEAALVESDQPALGWSLSTMADSPMDPMYYLEFEIGGITAIDPAQYKALDIVGLTRSVFKPGTDIPVFDYSGEVAGVEQLGIIHVTWSGVAPKQFDRAAGLRMATVQARALRF